MVEGFAETERNAHYEIGTHIIKKEHSYYQKEHSYYQKRNSSKRNTRIIKRNTPIIKKELILSKRNSSKRNTSELDDGYATNKKKGECKVRGTQLNYDAGMGVVFRIT